MICILTVICIYYIMSGDIAHKVSDRFMPTSKERTKSR